MFSGLSRIFEDFLLALWDFVRQRWSITKFGIVFRSIAESKKKKKKGQTLQSRATWTIPAATSRAEDKKDAVCRDRWDRVAGRAPAPRIPLQHNPFNSLQANLKLK